MEISLKDYIRTGEGANGASYDSIENPDMMLKLYFKDYPQQTVVEELEAARKVYDLGIPSPEPGELVSCDGCLGIKFRKIKGKRSFSRAFADEPERTEEYAREFARLCKRLHATPVPAGEFPEGSDQALDLLEKSKFLNEGQKERIRGFIRSVPAEGTALHGDMHFGNALTTLPKGAPLSDEHELYFIDLGYFARGCPLFDLGMMRNICLDSAEEFRVEAFHIDGRQTARIWDYFVDEYFFQEDALAEKYWGAGQTPQSVTDQILKFEAVKLMLVEYNLGFMPDHYRKLVMQAFDL